MRSLTIQKLIDVVENAYGPVMLYGSDPSEKHGTCFRITGVPVTFSVHTQEGRLPSSEYDIQIEGVPPGDYIYTAVVTLDTFLELVARIRSPVDQWPLMDEAAT